MDDFEDVRMALELTETAKEELGRAMEAQRKDTDLYGLKIGVHPGGCAGLQYSLSFQRGLGEDDIALEEDGYTFYVEKNHAPLLDGITIDYVETMMGGGFKIENPNAERSCGCGKSFG